MSIISSDRGRKRLVLGGVLSRSSAGACWILAMGNRSFLQGNRLHDRSFLQSIKAKSTTLLRKVSDLQIFQS